ncbi:class I SAM-dependent methyltransferase [Azospirillum sp.]|uniref:class I SAM-dependent methyltransferase n=1 Tax=Azospirillum sp. TaxID=34012 RepID=UPI002D712CCE|nr:class I SAM-dependent methyltransferase [Azospirillum sp.]HYD64563.1 class I SAM-dependent methyltransferase [Azospirillum sp.]
MSEQLQYLQSYKAVVDANLAAFPEDEAMSLAVGGEYELFGTLERQLLRQFGLADGHHVIDIGCGSGRLATKLAPFPGIRYSGTDIVPKMLEYTRRKCVSRPDFSFYRVEKIEVPEAVSAGDFVTFFSVFTHLLHEESYVYLEEAYRALNKGGKVVLSFLEFGIEHNWSVFMANVDWVRKRAYLGHINVFINRGDLAIWAEKIGFRVVDVISGDTPFIEIGDDQASEKVPGGRHAFGQSLCILEKP